jgi:hypothetical protein
VNVARADIPPDWQGAALYLAMIRALKAKEREIVALSSTPNNLLICSSGPADEVQFWWSPHQ